MIMICCSTEQNSTNLIPAVQINGIELVVIVESKHAKDKGWADGMVEVLNKRGIKTTKIDLSTEGSNRGGDIQLEWVISKINDFVVGNISASETIIWNIGGGLKPLMLAMYQCFFQRNMPQDRVCYLNPPNNFDVPTIEIIHNENGKLKANQIRTEVDLSAEEILMLYNQKIKSSRMFYHHRQQLPIKKFEDLFGFNDFREYAFRHTANKMIDKKESYSLEEIADLLRSNSRNKFVVESIEANLKDGILKKAVSAKELDTANQLKLSKRNVPLNTFFDSQGLNSLASNIKNLIFYKPDEIEKSLLARMLNFEEKVEYIDINNPKLAQKLNADSIKLDDTLFNSLGYTKIATYFEALLENRFYDFLTTHKHNIVEAYSSVTISAHGIGTIAEYDILLITKQGNAIAIEAKTFDFIQKDNDARQFNLERATSKFGEMYVVFPYDPEDFEKPYFTQKLAELPFKLNDRKKQFFVIADSVEESKFRVNFTDKKLKRVSEGGLLINCLDSFFERLKIKD